jgi:hypothetical protein
MIPHSAASIRALEVAIQKLLIDNARYLTLSRRGVDDISDLAAFFYVSLFRTLRHILRPFLTSNPTWIKRPTNYSARLRPEGHQIRRLFGDEVEKMLANTQSRSPSRVRGEKTIRVASSESLPMRQESADFVLSSPPYCTRIDYAVATSPELALVGFSLDSEFDKLRRELIGTSTVPGLAPPVSPEFGETCLSFLDAVCSHGSRASSTYYYKNHIQYFGSISKSLTEIGRVLKPGGRCALVVQDSYYKEIHNDLPRMIAEMASIKGLRVSDRRDFALSRTMAGINPRAGNYRDSFGAVESVLLLRK